MIDSQEVLRLAALDRYDVLDSPPEENFDRITRLAQRLLGVPMALITLLDGHRQWFKSKQGLDVPETCRKLAFCDIVVKQNAALVVPDTLEDERFRNNALVLGDPWLRFYAGVPLQTPDGQTLGSLCALDRVPRRITEDQLHGLTDLAHIVMRELELRALAETDAVTGTASRRGFQRAAERTFSLAQRHGNDLSCILFDLDHFKRINDTKGHAFGDLVLREVVQTAQTLLRKSDILGRLGGEEFGIVLPHSGPEVALRVAEKLRKVLARRLIVSDAGSVAVTASFGIASLEPSVPDLDTLTQRADTAMYAAKAAGRNRCLAWMPAATGPSSLRQRVMKAGSITSDAVEGSINCTIRRLSHDGARIDIVASAEVPERFDLRVPSDDFHRRCTIIERGERHMDVRFAREERTGAR